MEILFTAAAGFLGVMAAVVLTIATLAALSKLPKPLPLPPQDDSYLDEYWRVETPETQAKLLGPGGEQ